MASVNLNACDHAPSMTTPAEEVTLVVPKHNVVAPWEEEQSKPEINGVGGATE